MIFTRGETLLFVLFLSLSLLSKSFIMPRYSTRGATRALSMGTNVKVTTYNVLSSHLAAPSWFKACNPEYLDPSYRLQSLKNKLDDEIAQNSVICLQEVSHVWAGSLHAFFASRGYHFVTALYGSRFNNYMGIAVAVPLSKYNIEDVNIQRVVDTKYTARKPKPTFWGGVVNYFRGWVLQIATLLSLYKAPFDVWDSALYRSNQMICVRLQDKETSKSFVIGTYHMPCMFNYPSVMVIHAALSAQHILKYAENLPSIYVGDYNFKPSSGEYEVMTKGKIDDKHPDYPPPLDGDTWKPEVNPPLRSAYAEANGEEPNFTNYAKVQEQPVFVDTLDYIFLSPEWKVDGVRDLPHRDDIEGPLPNKDEPSDHILISAQVGLRDD